MVITLYPPYNIEKCLISRAIKAPGTRRKREEKRMKTQSIVFTAPGRAELLEEETRPLGPRDVLIQRHYSTISSGTERANLTGDENVNPRTPAAKAVFPRRGGYNGAATVLETGAEVKSVKPGDKVIVTWGCHTHYECVDEGNIHRLEDQQASLQDAAMALIATFPLAAVRKCRLELGEPAAVMGLGILGRIALQLLKAGGATPVIAVDPVAEKRAQALEFGADYALDSFAPDFAAQMKALSRGGVKVAVEVTGFGKALDQVLDGMAPFGRVALLGCTRHSDFSIDYYRKVHFPGIVLIGAHTMARPRLESSAGLWTERDDLLAVMDLVRWGRIDLKKMVEEVHSPLDAPQVYARLAADKSFPVVQFHWDLLGNS